MVTTLRTRDVLFTHSYTHARTHPHWHTHTHLHTQRWTHAHTNGHWHTYTHLHTQRWSHTRACTLTLSHTHPQTLAHVHHFSFCLSKTFRLLMSGTSTTTRVLRNVGPRGRLSVKNSKLLSKYRRSRWFLSEKSDDISFEDFMRSQTIFYKFISNSLKGISIDFSLEGFFHEGIICWKGRLYNVWSVM